MSDFLDLLEARAQAETGRRLIVVMLIVGAGVVGGLWAGSIAFGLMLTLSLTALVLS